MCPALFLCHRLRSCLQQNRVSYNQSGQRRAKHGTHTRTPVRQRRTHIILKFGFANQCSVVYVGCVCVCVWTKQTNVNDAMCRCRPYCDCEWARQYNVANTAVCGAYVMTHYFARYFIDVVHVVFHVCRSEPFATILWVRAHHAMSYFYIYALSKSKMTLFYVNFRFFISILTLRQFELFRMSISSSPSCRKPIGKN